MSWSVQHGVEMDLLRRQSCIFSRIISVFLRVVRWKERTPADHRKCIFTPHLLVTECVFKCVCERHPENGKEVREQEKRVFLGEKREQEKGEMCQEQILILSCTSPTCLPLSHTHSLSYPSLPLSPYLTFSQFFPPSLPPFLSRSRLFDLFSLQILQLFYSLPCQCVFFLCVSV